jgi:uncharacterized repeat protein (TIGR03803 family)
VRTAPFIYLLATLISGLLFVDRSTAQILKTLYNLSGGNDGAFPNAGLIISSNTLYGTTEYGQFAEDGGEDSGGVLFAIQTDGSGFKTVCFFSGEPFLMDGVILASNIFYGTSYGYNNVFSVNIDGSGLRTVYAFSGSEYPYASVISSGNMLYGTTTKGGSANNGTVFAVNTAGTVFTNLHSFTNSDGSDPVGGLVLSGTTLYGTAEGGGASGGGTIFAINTDGTGFTNLYNFSSLSSSNKDGAFPYGTIIVSGTTLYGTCYEGGSGGNGTIFAIHTDGTGFTNLHNFTKGTGIFTFIVANNDGAYPYAGLALSGITLYGTATSGGGAGTGTIFALNTDGTGFTNLHSFTATSGGRYEGTNTDGAYPYSVLVKSGSTLYGTAQQGGNYNYGTIFSLSLPPSLNITTSGTSVILTWPSNVAGFDYTGYSLQATTNLASPAWSAVSPPPVVVNGQETVTNAISGTQMFYRLAE